MKLSKCRSKKFGKIFIILGSFCSFLNWEGADIRPKSSLGKSLIAKRKNVKSLCYKYGNLSMVEVKNSVVQIKTQPHFLQKGNVYMELYFIMICFLFLKFNSCHAEHFYV